MYVDWNIPCISYSPKCYYGHLWHLVVRKERNVYLLKHSKHFRLFGIWYRIQIAKEETHRHHFMSYLSVRSWCDGSLDRSFMVEPLTYFSFQPVLHNWCNKGRGMCYPVCGMMHIKESLLLIRKSSPCGSSRFPLSLSEWSFTICPMPYNRK